MPDGRAEKLLLQLLSIPGGSGDEAAVAAFVAAQLRENGADANSIVDDGANRRSAHGGTTGNLVFKLAGTRRAPRRMLSAHLDTVPICVGSKVRRGKGFLESADPERGIGADNRAGVAVLLATAIDLLQSAPAGGRPKHGPLTFLWTVQEEIGLHGARNVRAGALGKPKLAFNFDGGAANKLVVGATGGYRMDIYVTGKASHAGNHPERGVSAIAIAARAVADLHENGWHGLIEKGRRRGTSNVGVIHGGAATNVVTDAVRLAAEARSHDPKFRERIVSQIEKAFRRAAKAVRSVDGACGAVRFEGRLDYESFRLPQDDPSLAAASAVVRAEGLDPEQAIANGGLDANWLSERVVPTVSLGCGQQNIHTVDERLDLAEFHRARRIAMRLALGPLAAEE